jgi:hypothetical protein
MLSSESMLEMLRSVGIKTTIVTETMGGGRTMEGERRQQKHRELCLTKELVIDEWGMVHLHDRGKREKERREKQEAREKAKRGELRAQRREEREQEKKRTQEKEQQDQQRKRRREMAEKKKSVGHDVGLLEARLTANEWIGSLGAGPK